MTDETEIKIEGLDNSVYAPDATNLIVPEGARPIPIQVATQTAPVVVKPQLVSAPAPCGTRSYFETDKASYADRAVMPDGTWFEFLPLEEEEIERYDETASRWCEAIGWTDEMFRTAQLLDRGISPEKLNLSVETLQSLVLTREQERTKNKIETEARKRVVLKSVIGWSLPPRCDDEHKAKLHKDIRRLLCDRIIGFSVYGFSDARFCGEGDTATA